MGWFAIVPALEFMIKDESMNITLKDKKLSGLTSVLGTIFIRFALGPLCEKFGPKRLQTVILVGGAIAVGCSGLIYSAESLIAFRFCIGLIGGAFVPCQYWTTMMFATDIVGKIKMKYLSSSKILLSSFISGTANATAGGWGNLGGGLALLFVAAVISGIQGAGVDETVAWRYAMIVPAAMLILCGIPMFFLSDDCPQGSWEKRMYNKATPGAAKKPMKERLLGVFKKDENGQRSVVFDYRVWILAIVYGCCFGVELAVNNSMSSYFYRYFNTDSERCEPLQNSNTYPADCSQISITTASMIASLFGMMNLFARAIGGVLSDFAFNRIGNRGRLLILFLTLLGEGIAIMAFTFIHNIWGAVAMLIVFSIFVQSSEGATYGLVPVINPKNIGAIAGIVGAGGNIGAVCWQALYRGTDDQGFAYFIQSLAIIASSLLVFLVSVDNSFLLCPKKRGDGHSQPSETQMQEQSSDNQNQQSVGQANPAFEA